MGLLDQDTLGMDTHAQTHTDTHVVFNAAPSDHGEHDVNTATSARCTWTEVPPHTNIQVRLDLNRM